MFTWFTKKHIIYRDAKSRGQLCVRFFKAHDLKLMVLINCVQSEDCANFVDCIFCTHERDLAMHWHSFFFPSGPNAWENGRCAWLSCLMRETFGRSVFNYVYHLTHSRNVFGWTQHYTVDDHLNNIKDVKCRMALLHIEEVPSHSPRYSKCISKPNLWPIPKHCRTVWQSFIVQPLSLIIDRATSVTKNEWLSKGHNVKVLAMCAFLCFGIFHRY